MSDEQKADSRHIISALILDHTYSDGLCPDEVSSWDSRDPECAACNALDAVIDAYLSAEQPLLTDES